MSLIAGVDSSTQSTKVEVRDLESGRVVARSSAPHPPTTPPVSEQDPAAWWSAFEHAWAGAGAPTVAAIGVGGQQHGMVALDAAGDVVRPACCGTTCVLRRRSPSWCEHLGGARRCAATIGSVPVASFTSPKCGGWRRTSRRTPRARVRPASARLVDAGGSPPAPLVGRNRPTGDASGTGYYSPATRDYGCRTSSPGRSIVTPASPQSRCRGSPTPRDRGRPPPVRRPVRWHRRQHGRRTGSGARTGRRGGLDRHIRHGILRAPIGRRRPTRGLRCPALPTRPVGTCRSSAR